MSENHQRYIPEHPVPMRLETIANTNSERIEFGKVIAVRVHVIAKLESFEIHDSDAEFIVVDENRQNRMMVKKILTSAFPRSRAEEFLAEDFVEIFGKVRVLENGTSFLNALSINVVSSIQFEAFKTITRFATKYYQENFAALPSSVHSTCSDELGLRKKAGALDRFPIDLLEQSSSQTNNMGVWPTEIEDLAAGISKTDVQMDSDSSDSSDSDDDTSDSDSSDEEDSEGEEEEDSFDAGPVVNGGLGGFEANEGAEKGAEPIQDEPMEDSFDAGPGQTTVIPEEQPPMVPAAVEYDSFEDL